MSRNRLYVASVAVGLLIGPLASASLSQPNVDGSALIAAARVADTAKAQAALATGVDVNDRYGDGSTALHWAAHRDTEDLVAVLLLAGADVNATDDHGVTALSLACLNGSMAIVKRLLTAGADPNAARINGETPLMTAAQVGNINVVQALLTAGADPDATESTLEQTALMRAVAENHTPVAKVLIESGASVSAQSKNGFTALLFAAQQGNLSAARLLLTSGADVNESAPDGIGGNTNAKTRYVPNTDAAALLVAIDSGRANLARLLLDHGADVNHAGAGRTALHATVQRQMPNLARELLDHGADPNARLARRLPFVSRRIRLSNGLAPSNIGATPFFLASSFGDLEMMQILLDRGADPMERTDDGTSALMVASGVDYVQGQDKYGRRRFNDDVPLQKSALETVRFLLDLGLDINATNHYKQTALHGAVYLGGSELVSFLVKHGANINAVNARGQTPWLIAAKGEYRSGSFNTKPQAAEALVQLGADTTLGHDLGKDFPNAKPDSLQ